MKSSVSVTLDKGKYSTKSKYKKKRPGDKSHVSVTLDKIDVCPWLP